MPQKVCDEKRSCTDQGLRQDKGFSLDVRVDPEEDTVWLIKDQMAILFDRDRLVISRHISNIYKEKELNETATRAKNAQVQMEGGRAVTRISEFFNLDVIISVGYRVKSTRGVLFRKWASSILKQYLLKGYATDEKRLLAHDKSLTELSCKVLSKHYWLSPDDDDYEKEDERYLQRLKRMLGKRVEVKVDRPLGSAHPLHPDIVYPVNYGHIEPMLAPDGDYQDAYVLGINKAVPSFSGVVIAAIRRLDDIEASSW